MDTIEKGRFPGDIVPALLHGWKRIVLCAVIMAMLFGAGGLAWGAMRMADVDARQTERDSYDLAMERYQLQKAALETEISALNSSIVKQQTYLEESVLMALDPYDFYEGTVALQLHTDYQILPGMAYQTPDPKEALRSAYTESLSSQQLLEAMAAGVQGDVRYMAELVTAQNSNGGLTVTVRFGENEGAQLLLDLVAAHLEAVQTHISDTVAEQPQAVVTQGVVHRLDPSLATTQQTKTEKLADTVKTINTVKTRLTDLVKPTLDANTWSAITKHLVLLPVLGALIGVVLCAAVMFWVYSGGSRVLTGTQLREQLGIKALGLYNPARSAYTAKDIAGRFPAHTSILLTGSRSSRHMENLAQELAKAMPHTTVVCCGSLLEEVEALEAMAQCDGVILAQVCYRSTCAEVQRQKQLIEDHGKKVLGCVLLEK